jgi:LPXTG-motif cell wall-anchored protein
MVATLLGVGLVGLTAVPAYAADVTDVTSLNAAIAADEPVITIANDFHLTAPIALIDYDVTIVGNGHTISADYFGAFAFDGGSATVRDLTVVQPSFAAFDFELQTGESATLTNVSAAQSEFGIAARLADGASIDVTGGIFTESASAGIDIVDHDGTGEISITGTTIMQADEGISLYLRGTTAASVEDVTITDAEYGIYVVGFDEATVDISGTDITAGVENNLGGVGYGLYLDIEDQNSVTFDDGSIIGDLGGGYFVDGVYSYQLGQTSVVISDSRISGSEYGIDASSLYDGSSLTLRGTTVTGSGETGVYGSFYGDKTTMTIVESTVSGSGNVGIIADLYDTATATVDSSTISDNVYGGAWFYLYEDSTATVIDSTVSGSTLDVDGWALWAGDYDQVPSGGASFALLNSTVTDNTAVVGVGFEYIRALVSHSIVAGNHIVPGGGSSTSGEFWVQDDEYNDVTVEWSLIGGFVDESAGAAYTEGDGVTTGVTDPGLGPLADNGGPTLTHLPASTSPALNAGNPAIAGAPALDQRGQARIAGSAIDIGAVEVQPALAVTGSDSAGPIWAGALLVMLGTGALLASRRRQRTSAP